MNIRFLAAILTALLLTTGCGPSKKVEKGSDEKIVLGTGTENKVATRPVTVVPPDVAAKTKATSPGKTK